MDEYLVLAFAEGADDVLCVDTGTKEHCEAEFMNQVADGDFGSSLLLVKVVQSAELRYDIRNWSDGGTEETSKDSAGGRDIIAEYSRFCAAKGEDC